jgi:hypothetical protein
MRCRADAALAVDDLIDPTRWHADRDGEPVLADLQGLQKLLHQDLARVVPVLRDVEISRST